MMGAGEKCVAALDAMNQPVVHQKIQRTIDRDRRRARHGLGQFVDHFIGTERPMTRQQRAKNLPADRREFLTAADTDLLGMRKRILGTASVVMIRIGKCRLRGSHRFNM